MALRLLDQIDQLIEDTVDDEEKKKKEELFQTTQVITTLKNNLLSFHNLRFLSRYKFTRNSSIFTTLKHHDLLIYGYCHQYGHTNILNNDIIDFILKFYQILHIQMIVIGAVLDVKPNINGTVELKSNSVYGFASIRGDIPIIINNTTHSQTQNTNKYYYEFIVGELSVELAQIGFCDDDCFPDGYINGIGDDEHSWAFDGGRVKIWGNKGNENSYESPYGRKWKMGDTVGCCVDIICDHNEITCDFGFYLNGGYFGKAFTGQKYSGNIYPAASFSCRDKGKIYGTMIFSEHQFKYKPKGYKAII